MSNDLTASRTNQLNGMVLAYWDKKNKEDADKVESNIAYDNKSNVEEHIEETILWNNSSETKEVETATKLQNNVVEIKNNDLSATVFLDNVNSLAAKMSGPVAKLKEEKIALQDELQKLKKEVTLLNSQKAYLERANAILKQNAEITARKHEKQLERVKNEQIELLNDKAELESRIEFIKQPARSPVETKAVLEEIFQNFKDLKNTYDKRLSELSNYTKAQNTEVKNALIIDIQSEGNKLNDIAQEVEILFTAHANKCKDEKVIELRKEIYKLWQDSNMMGYELTLSRIQLGKAMKLVELEENFKETKALYDNQLKELSVPKAQMPGVSSHVTGYYVDTQKLGDYQNFLETVRAKFDEINKAAFKGQKAITKYHETFKPLEDKTEGARKIAVDNLEQANLNEVQSKLLRNKCDSELKLIYAKSIAAWTELKKTQAAVHQQVAILEDGWKAENKKLPTVFGGTLDDAKKLKYEPAATI